jgi:hypothetical protein
MTLANVGETAATITDVGADLGRRNIESGIWGMPGLEASPQPVSLIILESGQRHTAKVTAKQSVSDIIVDAEGSWHRTITAVEHRRE